MNRAHMLAAMAETEHDLLIIGGGITGAGVAREASIRGQRVALVEQFDFAAGTSSRSTKLIHGGLRYLKQFDFKLVREAVEERQRLLQMAPHLVDATAFLFPVYRGDPDALIALRAGLFVYDLFARMQAAVPHRILSPARVVQEEPGLRRDGLVGGAIYTDGRTDDARLTLEVIQSAARYGAVLANYARVESFVRHPNGKLAGARVRDVLSDEMLEVRAKRILAAAGPWADAIRQLDDAAAPPLLRLTKGVHITVSAPRLPLSHAVVIRGRDGRMMFAIPRGVHTYVGTTDTDFNDDPTTVTADAEDVEYILDAANRTFPQARLGAGEVTSTWAGLRPLIRPGDTADPSAVSRDYDIFHSPSGLVSIGGGKLTAFRAMASHIVDELFPGSRTPASLGASLGPLPGFSGRLPTAADFERLAARTGARPAEVQRWGARYGSALEQVAAELSPTTSGDPAADWSRAMTRHAVRAEMAQRLEDVWSRRTDLMLFSDTNGRQLIEPLGAEMAELLGWSSARLEQEKQRVAAGIDSMFRWRDAFDTKKGGAVLTTVSTDSQGSPVPGLPRP